MSLAELTEIAKRRYEYGDYGHAHLRVTTGVWAEMLRLSPPRLARPLTPVWDPIGDVQAIPIVVDDDLPSPCSWQLVDNSTREVLRAGTIEEEKDHG